MKRLYSTAATLVLAGALVLPTATTAQAADSDLTVSVTLSVYNKGSVGHALEVYDRTKQIDEGKCKSFSNGNNDYRIEFAQGDNFTRCSIFPPFEGPENAGKYYSLDDKGEFIFVYSSEQLMQETEFLGRPRDIGYISIRPLVFDLDSASAGAKFTDYWAETIQNTPPSNRSSCGISPMERSPSTARRRMLTRAMRPSPHNTARRFPHLSL